MLSSSCSIVLAPITIEGTNCFPSNHLSATWGIVFSKKGEKDDKTSSPWDRTLSKQTVNGRPAAKSLNRKLEWNESGKSPWALAMSFIVLSTCQTCLFSPNQSRSGWLWMARPDAAPSPGNARTFRHRVTLLGYLSTQPASEAMHRN